MSFPELNKPYHLFATFFGIGLLKPAPGTWGSLAGVLLWYFLDFLHLLYLYYFASFHIIFMVGMF